MAGFGEIGLLSTVSGGVNFLSYRRAVWLYLKKKKQLVIYSPGPSNSTA